MIRDDCPTCGHTPLDYDSAMAGPVEVTRAYWCAECGWSMIVNMPTPETEEQP